MDTPKLLESKYMYDTSSYFKVITEELVLNSEDLSQLIQSLNDKIAELEKRLITLEGSNNNI